MAVQYRTIKRFPNYRFGSDGSVWSKYKIGGNGKTCKWHKKRFRPTRETNRYPQVELVQRIDGERKKSSFRVHRLICEAFHGPCPKEMKVCRHLNDNPLDNRSENLSWGTQKQNMADRANNNEDPRHRNAKMTIMQVREARALRRHTNMTLKQIGSVYGVTDSALMRTVRGDYYVYA